MRLQNVVSAIAALAVGVSAGPKEVIQLTDDNYDTEMGSYEYVMVAFGASWCPYSRQLEPIWDSAAAAYESDAKIAFARIDCEQNKPTCKSLGIMKYPTIKLFQNKVARPNEYRGARTVPGFKNFIDQETMPAIKPVTNYDQIKALGAKFGEKSIVAYFQNKDQLPKYERIAEQLRHFCNFYITEDPNLISAKNAKPRMFYFKARGDFSELYSNDDPNQELDADALSQWATGLCRPLVQHLTFENSEAITEEGKPLVIMFSRADDIQSQDLFRRKVEEQLKDERRVKFVIADGSQFEHPLQHISKSLNDLPVIAVDSFQHIYDFGNFHGINQEGRLRTFINDIFNEQLHHRFHHGNPLAQTCMWRQTSNCKSNGEREVHQDAPCTSQIIPQRSGFCECGTEYAGLVLYFDCGHELFTCQHACAKAAAEDSRRAALAGCMWRQTSGCDPDGEREDPFDKDCLTPIFSGQSGYCECYPGGPRIKYTCEHPEFVCTDVCMEHMIKEGINPDATMPNPAAQPQAGDAPPTQFRFQDPAEKQQQQQQQQQEGQVPPPQPGLKQMGAQTDQGHQRMHQGEQPKVDTNPDGQSIVDKLRPSERRYSFVRRDEL